METFKLVLIIIVAVGIIAGLFVACYVSLCPQDLLVVKHAIKRGKDLDDFEVTGRKHEDKIRRLLEKNNYTYQRIDLEPEVRIVVGLGKIKFLNGTTKYQVYTSENCFTEIDKQQYNALKDSLGKEITFHAYDMKWRKTNKK